MKFAKILICTILMVAILSVPCFATNEGTYGHYISPGQYVISDTVNYRPVFILDFDFISDGVTFDAIQLTDTSLILYLMDGSTTSAYSFANGWYRDAYRYITIVEPFYIYDASQYLWWMSNVTRVDADYDSSFFDEVLSAFTFVGQWISEAVDDLTAMFWVDNSLTLVGTLSVASLAMAVSFLIIGLISRFLRFRG